MVEHELLMGSRIMPLATSLPIPAQGGPWACKPTSGHGGHLLLDVTKKEEEPSAFQYRGNTEDRKGPYRVSNLNSPLHLDVANID